jgi:hypothetical protein
MYKRCLDTRRLPLWERQQTDDETDRLVQEKLVKVYETHAVISTLMCGCSLSLTESKHQHSNIILVHDIARGYCIIFSLSCATLSILFTSIFSATPYRHTLELMRYLEFSLNFPLFFLISSMFSFVIAITLQYRPPVLYWIAPVSVSISTGTYIFYQRLKHRLYTIVLDDDDSVMANNLKMKQITNI